MLRVLIADGNQQVRQTLRKAVEAYPAHVIAEVSNGVDAVLAARHQQPDLALLDLCMPVMNGLRAAEQISAIRPGIPIVIVTEHINKAYIETAFQSGAQGYVFKRRLVSELIRAIEIVLSGGSYCSRTAS